MWMSFHRNRWLAALVVAGAFSLCSARAGVTQAMWVFPGASGPNPVTDPTARQTLVANASASGVTLYYVSIYSSTPNSAGRYMNDESAIAALLTQIHSAGGRMFAAYGAPDWPSLGCDPNAFPLQRMAEVAAFNTAHPSTRIDGVILDVEPPEPQNAPAYQALLAQYDCIRATLPTNVDLATAIRFFWNDVVEYPAGSGVNRPVYAHILRMNLRNVVVMGYRDFVGPADCSSDGIVCLDQDEIAYAAGIGKYELVLAGLETSNPVTNDLLSKETFYEEGQAAMNATAQTVLDHFGGYNGLGGFAVHNYGSTYLAGTPKAWPPTNTGFPTTSHEISVQAVTRLANGHVRLQGVGVPGRVYSVLASTTPDFASYQTIGMIVTNAAGTFDYDDFTAVGITKRFYRLVLLRPV